jgi:hypothetical protein
MRLRRRSAAKPRKPPDMSVTVELRGPCPKDVVDVVDAVAHAKRLDRTAMVNRILTEWAEQKAYESQCIERVTRGNPVIGSGSESEWK